MSKKILMRILIVCILAAVVFVGVVLFWYGFKYLPQRISGGMIFLDALPCSGDKYADKQESSEVLMEISKVEYFRRRD